MILFSVWTHASTDPFALEPLIECTVIVVLVDKPKFGKTKFPKLYDSIYNNPMSSQLFIGGKKFPQLNPISMISGGMVEKIKIQDGPHRIELEIMGQPISRSGNLFIDGNLVARITCH